MGLYYRLMWDPTITYEQRLDSLAVLVRDIRPTGSLPCLQPHVWDSKPEFGGIPLDLVREIPISAAPTTLEGVPQGIVDFVADLVSGPVQMRGTVDQCDADVLARIGSRYPWPFNRAFHDLKIAERIAIRFQNVLADPEVVAALGRCGINIRLQHVSGPCEVPGGTDYGADPAAEYGSGGRLRRLA
ncbi:hypothetical protein BVRB_027820 [Beta vulgaris subsp. vulgaris]|uniref:Uncharacterized protein n=1 Tax=Beta vulgaris subsp. vulgaris TaxID=3555 RepID=A0A0J8AYL0_BETVV|nr:hypothetical protein BVRB_027820 [Beta vulgaris subsp. vulgaris]